MNAMKIKGLVDELREITNPAKLKTDQEHNYDRQRESEIVRELGETDADAVFDRYGKYGQKIVLTSYVSEFRPADVDEGCE